MSLDKSTWHPLRPVPERAPPPDFKHVARGEPREKFAYYNVEGELLGYQCVFTKSDGSDVFHTRTFCNELRDGRGTGKERWRWISFPKLRPLYGVERLNDPDRHLVVIVFDEASVDAVAQALPRAIPISWPGGLRAIDDVDWSGLRGSIVAIWPSVTRATETTEHEQHRLIPMERQPAFLAAQKLASIVKQYGCPMIGVVDSLGDGSLPDGWSPALGFKSGFFESAAFNEWWKTRWLGEDITKIKKQKAAEAAPPVDPNDKRRLIRWKDGMLPQLVDQAEEALMQDGERIYQRGSMLVRIIQQSKLSVRNYERTEGGALGIVPVEHPYLIELMTRAARWEKFDKRSESWRAVNAPELAATTYLARNGHWKVPRLMAAISTPTLRPDGSVLQRPGYCPKTCTWYDPCGVKFPEIPDQATHQDASAALELLRKGFSTFPFDTDIDESVFLSLVLTGLVRRSLPAAPLGAISAPAGGSGKSMLADCISILAAGVAAPVMSFPDTDEEASKTMLAVLAAGDAVVAIDNVERPLQGDWLCSMLTSESFRARVLGRTEMITVPTSTLFVANGNQLQIQGDLRLRALLCRIDPKMEKPEQREFELDMREWLTAHRPKLVAAALTIMRAFFATGQRPSDLVKPWGRFERWSAMVRAPLVWLGMEDPCASHKQLEGQDPERVAIIKVMSAWALAFGNKSGTAREACDLALNDTRLRDALSDVAADRQGGLSTKRLGHWLNRREDRIVNGMKFMRDGERDHTTVWKLEGQK